MGRLEIIGFAKLPKDNATYSERNKYVEKSAEEIEKILRDLGLRENEDYSKYIASTPSFSVRIYLDKADKNRHSYLYLNAKHFRIELEFEYSSVYLPLCYLSIDFYNDGGVGIYSGDYELDYEHFAILTNYFFHYIRDFRKKNFQILRRMLSKWLC